MDDICDMADVFIQAERESARITAQLSKGLPSIGRCYNCNEDDPKIMAGRVFCCSECRDDYEIRQEARKRNGK